MLSPAQSTSIFSLHLYDVLSCKSYIKYFTLSSLSGTIVSSRTPHFPYKYGLIEVQTSTSQVWKALDRLWALFHFLGLINKKKN